MRMLCDALQDVRSSCISKAIWTRILPKLASEEKELAAWEASRRDFPRPSTPFVDAMVAAVEALVGAGMKDLDYDLAQFAADFYARRNSSFHGRSFDL